MKLSHAVRAAALGAAFVCAQGTPLDAGAQGRWGVYQEPAREREPRERSYPERDDDPRQPSSADVPAAPQSPAPQGQGPWRAEPPPERNVDAAVARCHSLRRDLEAVLRLEGRGGDQRLMESLREKRQSIYQQQLSAGC